MCGAIEEILKLRVAYFEDDGVTPVTPETAAAVRAAAEALRAQGFQVEAWRPQNLDRVWQLWWNLFGRAVQMAFASTVEGREAELSPMYRAWRERVALEPSIDGREWLNTLVGRDALRERLLRQMETFPILIVSGLRCSGVSSWGAGMDGAGAQGGIFEGDELFAVV